MIDKYEEEIQNNVFQNANTEILKIMHISQNQINDFFEAPDIQNAAFHIYFKNIINKEFNEQNLCIVHPAKIRFKFKMPYRTNIPNKEEVNQEEKEAILTRISFEDGCYSICFYIEENGIKIEFFLMINKNKQIYLEEMLYTQPLLLLNYKEKSSTNNTHLHFDDIYDYTRQEVKQQFDITAIDKIIKDFNKYRRNIINYVENKRTQYLDDNPIVNNNFITAKKLHELKQDKKKLQQTQEDLRQISIQINLTINQTQKLIDYINNQITDKIDNQNNQITDKIDNQNNQITDKIDNQNNQITDKINQINQKINEQTQKIKDIKQQIEFKTKEEKSLSKKYFLSQNSTDLENLENQQKTLGEKQRLKRSQEIKTLFNNDTLKTPIASRFFKPEDLQTLSKTSTIFNKDQITYTKPDMQLFLEIPNSEIEYAIIVDSQLSKQDNIAYLMWNPTEINQTIKFNIKIDGKERTLNLKYVRYTKNQYIDVGMEDESTKEWCQIFYIDNTFLFLPNRSQSIKVINYKGESPQIEFLISAKIINAATINNNEIDLNSIDKIISEMKIYKEVIQKMIGSHDLYENTLNKIESKNKLIKLNKEIQLTTEECKDILRDMNYQTELENLDQKQQQLIEQYKKLLLLTQKELKTPSQKDQEGENKKDHHLIEELNQKIIEEQIQNPTEQEYTEYISQADTLIQGMKQSITKQKKMDAKTQQQSNQIEELIKMQKQIQLDLELMKAQSKQEQSELEQSKQEQSKQEQSELEQSKLEQSKQEQSKQEQSKLEQSRQEQSELEKKLNQLTLELEQKRIQLELKQKQSEQKLNQLKLKLVGTAAQDNNNEEKQENKTTEQDKEKQISVLNGLNSPQQLQIAAVAVVLLLAFTIKGSDITPMESTIKPKRKKIRTN